LGYVFRVRAAVTADDAAIAARCCPEGVTLSCQEPDSEGDRACECGS
jgi:hypothetical protein